MWRICSRHSNILQDRDDELAARVDIVENEKDDEEEETEGSARPIMLAPSETKPMNR